MRGHVGDKVIKMKENELVQHISFELRPWSSRQSRFDLGICFIFVDLIIVIGLSVSWPVASPYFE